MSRRSPSSLLLPAAVLLITLILLIRFFTSPSIPLDPPEHPTFAGEAFDTDTFYIREAWEREYYLVAFSAYQNALYAKRAARYFPYIEQALDKRHLPDDLKYLAVAESALRVEALSTAGAAGLWQFIPDTARAYGLRVDDTIDERLHFQKSTDAALTYLEKLHNDFGSWHLAAAAYNRGENGLRRDMNAQKSARTYADLVLNSETSRYVYRIAALREVLSQPSKYRFSGAGESYDLPATRTVTVSSLPDLDAYALSQGTTLRALKELNPWILGTTLPEGTWQLTLPK